jgi:hypothetical protein
VLDSLLRHLILKRFAQNDYAPESILVNSFSNLSKNSSFLSTANFFTLLHSSVELKSILKIIFVWPTATS